MDCNYRKFAGTNGSCLDSYDLQQINIRTCYVLGTAYNAFHTCMIMPRINYKSTQRTPQCGSGGNRIAAQLGCTWPSRFLCC